jgi:rhodanese-related sulfurtransferase
MVIPWVDEPHHFCELNGAGMISIKSPFSLIALLLALSISGCQFQQPDYVTMISPNELQSLMQQQDIFLVDVHTPQQRHIKGTDAFIPYDQVEKYTDRLPQDKATPIYIYCEGGPMGNSAAKSLHQLGYTHLTNLEGGAAAWRTAGFELE